MSAAKKPRSWLRLDNAAKIFPPTSDNRDTKVFRFVCELVEEVDPTVLQTALDHTLEMFPLYRYVLKRGLFWYYFEESPLLPTVHAESKPPCSPLYLRTSKSLLFEVTYYDRRINLEVYHALADGTGALHFLRTLVLYYLSEVHAQELGNQPLRLGYDASTSQKSGDSFSKYYSGKKISQKGPRAPRAYKMRWEKTPDNRLGIVEGEVSTSALAQLTKEKGVTISEYLLANFICSIHDTMTLQEAKRPVVISVPVNLRRFFPSESARNFFSVIACEYDFSQGAGTFEDVLRRVHRSFSDQLTIDRLEPRLNRLSSLEHGLLTKLVPLVIKDLILKLFYWLSDRETTAAFSNLGRITMPPETVPFIRLFDIFVSTKRPQVCLCSFEDRMMITFTSAFTNTDIERCFFRRLTASGLEVTLSSNVDDIY